MAFLRIDKLKLENIRCFENQTFSFTEGVNVITGANGSGKSTIITAIGFGLYGADYLYESDLLKADLIKRNETEAKIRLTFTTHEGTFLSDYKLKASGSDYWRLYEVGNDQPIAETISETREVIQSQLGENIDHQTFKTALCSRQGEITKLLDAKPSRRGDLIKKILGLENFDRTNRVMAKFKSSIEQETEVKETTLETLNNNMMDEKKIKDEITQLDTKIEKMKKDLQIAENKVENLQEKVNQGVEKQNRITVLKENMENLKTEIDALNLSINKMKSQKEKYEKQLEMKEITTEGIQALLQKENTELNQFNLDLQENKTAKQNYTQNEQEADKLKIQIDRMESNISSNKTELDNLTSDQSIAEKKSKAEEINVTLKSFEKEKSSLQREIKTLEENQESNKKRQSELKKNKDDVKQEFKNKFDQPIENLDEILADTKKNKQSTNEELDVIKEKLSDTQQKIGEDKARIEAINQTIAVLGSTEIDSDCPICRRSLENVNKSDLISIQEELKKDVETSLEKINEKRSEHENDKVTLEKKLEEITSNITELERFADKSKQLLKDEKEIKSLSEKIEETEKKLSPLKDKLEELLKTDPSELRKKLELLQSEIQKIEDLNTQISKLETQKTAKIENYEKLKDKNKALDINQIKKTITELTKKKEEAEKLINTLSEIILPLLNKYSQANSEISLKKSQLGENNIELKNLEKTFDEKELAKHQEELKSKTKQMGEFENGIKEAEKDITRLNEDLQKAKEQKEEQTRLNHELDELATLLPLTEKIQKILNDAPEYLIAKTSSKISTHLTNMLRQLLPNQGFERAKFESDGDVIVYSNGQPVDKNTLSGGERTVLALALRMALADYVAPLQYLTLDEPTNHLDAQRVEEFIEIIDQEQLFAQSKGQLLLVTHKPEFNRNAQNSIELEIKDGRRQKLSARSTPTS